MRSNTFRVDICDAYEEAMRKLVDGPSLCGPGTTAGMCGPPLRCARSVACCWFKRGAGARPRSEVLTAASRNGLSKTRDNGEVRAHIVGIFPIPNSGSAVEF